jgi:hypothetical protein
MHAVLQSFCPRSICPASTPETPEARSLKTLAICVLWPSPPLSAAPAPGAPAPASPCCCGGAPPAGPSSGTAPPAPAPPRPHASAAVSGTTPPGCGTWLHTNKTTAHPGLTTACTRHNHKRQAERNGDDSSEGGQVYRYLEADLDKLDPEQPLMQGEPPRHKELGTAPHLAHWPRPAGAH